MKYATIGEVEAGFRTLTEAEKATGEQLLEEASVMIDAMAPKVHDGKIKSFVVRRMVRRALGSADNMMPLGAANGTISALGYSQSVTFDGSGSSGELYISKTEKRMLGMGDKVGSRSPLEVDA